MCVPLYQLVPALLPVLCCCCASTEFMPAAVDPEAPKASRPALCLVSDAGVQPGGAFSCDASENYMRRLCPCVKGSGSSSSKSSSTKASSSGSGQEEGSSRGEADRQGVSSSSKSSGSSSRGGDAAAVPADKKQQQQQEQGPDQLGATQTEGVGDDAAETGAADGEGNAAEGQEYDEDPNRGDEGN